MASERGLSTEFSQHIRLIDRISWHRFQLNKLLICKYKQIKTFSHMTLHDFTRKSQLQIYYYIFI